MPSLFTHAASVKNVTLPGAENLHFVYMHLSGPCWQILVDDLRPLTYLISVKTILNLLPWGLRASVSSHFLWRCTLETTGAALGGKTLGTLYSRAVTLLVNSFPNFLDSSVPLEHGVIMVASRYVAQLSGVCPRHTDSGQSHHKRFKWGLLCLVFID